MKLCINHMILLALMVGLLAGAVPCKGRILFQSATATSSSSDGTTVVEASTSEDGTSSTATAVSTGGSATSSATATAGGTASASATAGGASSILAPGKGGVDLNGLVEKIYERVTQRSERGEDLKTAAEREVTSQRLSIASVWGEVLGSVGLRGRGAECDDIENLAKTQSEDFAQALIDGLVSVKGGLSESAQDDIRSTIGSGMKEAFEAAADAACSISGFSISARVKFGQALVGPVADVFVIAAQDENINLGRVTEPEPDMDKPEEEPEPDMDKPEEEPEPDMDKPEEETETNGSSIIVVGDGDTSRCSESFIVCCLDRKILSGKCDCLGGRCDAVFEDGMWKDQSGLQCSCS